MQLFEGSRNLLSALLRGPWPAMVFVSEARCPGAAAPLRRRAAASPGRRLAPLRRPMLAAYRRRARTPIAAGRSKTLNAAALPPTLSRPPSLLSLSLWLAQVVQTVILADFCYHYVRAYTHGSGIVRLPV